MKDRFLGNTQEERRETMIRILIANPELDKRLRMNTAKIQAQNIHEDNDHKTIEQMLLTGNKGFIDMTLPEFIDNEWSDLPENLSEIPDYYFEEGE